MEIGAVASQSARQFLHEILRQLMARVDARESENVDPEYPPFGVTLNRDSYDSRRAAYLAFLVEHHELLFEVHNRWADEASRELFLSLLLFRALGHERVKLPSNNAAFWRAKALLNEMPSTPSTLTVEGAEQFRHFDVGLDNAHCLVDCLPANILFTFLLGQYYLRRGTVVVMPGSGDHVIDAGACFGDTAIDLAHVVGSHGRVHAFEVVDAHLRVIEHNLGQNGGLGNIVVHRCALGDEERAGEVVHSAPNPGFSVADRRFTPRLRRLDDLVGTGEIERVDFIKMDIEGNELQALRGAEQVLRRYRPRLAISLYHRWEDYFRIPIHLHALCLGYKFYLENYTISDGETVLYCVA
jgi:FkbM family methyltransferase